TATSVLHQATVPLLLARPAALHHAELAPATIPSTARTDAEESEVPTIDVRLSEMDLELIEHGLKALAYAPGYDYGQVVAAQALARHLETSTRAEAGEPLAVR